MFTPSTKRMLASALGIALFSLQFAMLPHTLRAQEDTTAVLAPSAPQALTLDALDQGVRLSWLPSVAGDFPLAGYVILRSEDGQAYQTVATSAADSTQYDDPDGKNGSWYEVQATDNQVPPHLSEPTSPAQYQPPSADEMSNTATSTSPSPKGTPTPASTLATPSPDPTQEATPTPEPATPAATETPTPESSPPPTAPENSATPAAAATPAPTLTPTPNSAPPATQQEVHQQAVTDFYKQVADDARVLRVQSPDQQATTLNQMSKQHIATLNTTVVQQATELVVPILTTLQAEKVAVLDSLPNLSSDSQSQAKRSCLQETADLETIVTTVSDSSQIGIYHALALCQLILQAP